MMGNVWEWTATTMASQGHATKEPMRIARGSGWSSKATIELTLEDSAEFAYPGLRFRRAKGANVSATPTPWMRFHAAS
jgi:formylglycine-generating enzyme required for sulfatase activity